MLVHLPKVRSAKAPLVVVLHGCTQTAAGYARGAGWIELADRCGFVLVCPEQSRANNPNLCFNWFIPDDIARGAGEAASIHAMVRLAVAAYDLDARRVFVTGLSAGGAMANAMLAAYPESFAAGAIVAGLPYGVASNVQEALGAMRHARRPPSRGPGDAARRASGHLGPWPRVSVWQGNEDATVLAGVAEDVARQWRDLHGVEAVAADVQTSGARRDTVWRNRRGEAVVTLHQLAGMGHGTPLGCSLDDGCGTAGSLSAGGRRFFHPGNRPVLGLDRCGPHTRAGSPHPLPCRPRASHTGVAPDGERLAAASCGGGSRRRDHRRAPQRRPAQVGRLASAPSCTEPAGVVSLHRR